MAFEISWTDEAIDTYQKIIAYLEIRFTDREISRFIDATDNKLRLISRFPTGYRTSPRYKNVHYTNILGKTMLVYRVNATLRRVELLMFYDGRMNITRFT